MIIKKKYPPNIEEIMKVFPINNNTIYTHGENIFAPHIDFDLPNDLIVHEETHSKQQSGFSSPDEWWTKYITDKKFRYSQEVEAYQNQYKAFCSVVKDRNRRFNFLVTIARDLSSPLYGNMVDFFTATRVIKS